MREIKFRAWKKGKHYGPEYGIKNADTGEPIEWDTEPGMVYCFNPMSHGEINAFDFSFLEDWENGLYILMQFTGLKDKSGKEIYDGDIVLTPGGQRLSVDIEYAMLGDPKFWSITPSECAVIGNLYESPELIEGPRP